MQQNITLPSEQEIEERWRYINSSMIMTDPFIHEFLIIMNKRANPLIPTMRVGVEGARIILEYNPFFLTLLTDEAIRWVLYHEVFHVALHHCTLRAPSDTKNMKIFNTAADLAVNPLIKTTGLVRAPDPKVITPLWPKQFGWDDKLSMEQYLQLLWKWDKEQEDKKNKQKGGDQGDGGQGDDGQDDTGDGANNSSASSSAVDNAPGGGQLVDDHGLFQESEIIDQIIRNKVEEMLTQSKFWGNMDGHTKALIEAAQKSKVPWYKHLRHQLGRFVVDERQPTTSRPNRRYGYPFQGTTPLCVDRILFACDTSGSVSNRAFSQMITEMNKAREHNPIDMVQFDWSIQVGPIPFDKKMKRLEAQGRGGTRFGPVFELAEKMRYKALVILTDGYAEAPEKPRYVKDVIWCLVEEGKPPVPWGKVIKVYDTYL